ncbi:MAG: hypothetical protein WKF73_02790 [Nocardioidaceae bacterium]
MRGSTVDEPSTTISPDKGFAFTAAFPAGGLSAGGFLSGFPMVPRPGHRTR